MILRVERRCRKLETNEMDYDRKDWRPTLLNIGEIRAAFNVRTIAMSGTMTQQVLEDIRIYIGLPILLTESETREVRLSVYSRPVAKKFQSLADSLISLVREFRGNLPRILV